MLKMVVFDDEYIVLEGLKRMIDWEKYGIELVGTAMNGYEAISLFINQKPDIVLTDIRMPGLDGLAVIEKILAEVPETVCIVFSGFNEVEYLKKAIKLGVMDYFEKPVTLSMVQEVMKRTIKKINEKKRLERLEADWEKNYHIRLEKATLDLLTLGEQGEWNWRNVFGNKSNKIVGITVLAMKDHVKLLDSYDCQIVYAYYGGTYFLVLFHFDNNNEEVIITHFLKQLDHQILGGLGSTYYQMKDASKSYREAFYAMEYGMFMGEKRLVKFKDIQRRTSVFEDFSKYKQAISAYLRVGDDKRLLEQVNLFIHKLEAQIKSREILENEILHLIYLCLEIVKEAEKDVCSREGFWAKYFPQQEIREIETWDKMVEWLHEQLNRMLGQIINIQQVSKQDAMEKACIFIDQFYNEAITLQDVADHVQITPTYFSSLFREKVGMTYIQYLTNKRIGKAKEMLIKGAKVMEVSEKVGYHSYRHFSEVFKRHTGNNPSEYKNIT
ncbi:response regulator [Lederbergia galactosidilytica]|uniref:response regulator n=1 Tax=Lederbergia galactosidilytica TaxID=217031 RepID=UPI001EE6358C|nr:response regulator [Lederbergia galactosidilytica]